MRNVIKTAMTFILRLQINRELKDILLVTNMTLMCFRADISEHCNKIK